MGFELVKHKDVYNIMGGLGGGVYSTSLMCIGCISPVKYWCRKSFFAPIVPILSDYINYKFRQERKCPKDFIITATTNTPGRTTNIS